MSRIFFAFIMRLSLIFILASPVYAADADYRIVIKDHHFDPAELVIPVDQKVKIWVENQDASAEEFESYALNREKVVAGHGKAAIFIGPLKPGTYKYFGEFNQATAQFKKFTWTQIGSDAPGTAEEWVNQNDCASDAALQDIVNRCAAYGGVSEFLQVPAGNFNTCRLPLQQGGTVNVGVVPFAVVRIQTDVQGKPLVASLTAVTRGI